MSPKEKKTRLILELETQEMKCSMGQNLQACQQKKKPMLASINRVIPTIVNIDSVKILLHSKRPFWTLS